MRKIFKRIVAAATSALVALTPITVMADTYEPGEETNIVVQLYAQNGANDNESLSWAWMDTMDDGMKLLYQTPQHYTMIIDNSAFSNLVDPVYTFGFQLGYYGLTTGQTLECVISAENVVAHFDGYDDVTLPSFYVEEGNTMRNGKAKVPFKTVFAADAPIADMFKHITYIEFDANVATFIIRDADGNVITNADLNPTEPATEAPTTAAPETTTVKETEAPTTAAPETTIEETEVTAPVETTTAAAQDNGKDSNTTKIIISIVFVVLLLGALGVVGFNFMKRK